MNAPDGHASDRSFTVDAPSGPCSDGGLVDASGGLPSDGGLRHASSGVGSDAGLVVDDPGGVGSDAGLVVEAPGEVGSDGSLVVDLPGGLPSDGGLVVDAAKRAVASSPSRGDRPDSSGGHAVMLRAWDEPAQCRSPILGNGGEREARFVLACIADAGSPALAEAVGARGAHRVLTEIRERRSSIAAAERWSRRLDLLDLDAVRSAAAAVRGRFLIPGDAEWPDGLDDLAAVRSAVGGGAPIGLWVRGLGSPSVPSVAVVGARDATAYGATVAGELGAGLAEAGVTVVSGGAFGIDAAAHRGALIAGGRTVAVLACGIDVAYPRAHADLLDRIAQQGQLISELPPGATPTKQGFLVRNRLVAAMSAVTVVVEAAYRSGALNTAAWAAASLRVVAAVPGPVTSPLSAGCHRLLRDGGAVLVTGTDEVLELARPVGASPDADAPQDDGPVDPRAGLGAAATRVLEAVPARGGIGLAGLVAATGDPTVTLLDALGDLEERGLIQQRPGGWTLSVSSRSALRRRSERRH